MKLEIFLGSLLIGSALGRPLEQINEEELNIHPNSNEPLTALKHARSTQKQKRQFFGPKGFQSLTALQTLQNLGSALLQPNAPLRQGLGEATNPTPWGSYSDVQPEPQVQAELQPAAAGWDSTAVAEAAPQRGSTAAPVDEQPIAWDSTAVPSEQEATYPQPVEAQPVDAQPAVSWDSNSVAVAPSHVEPPAVATTVSAAKSLSLAAPMSFSYFSPSPWSPSPYRSPSPSPSPRSSTSSSSVPAVPASPSVASPSVALSSVASPSVASPSVAAPSPASSSSSSSSSRSRSPSAPPAKTVSDPDSAPAKTPSPKTASSSTATTAAAESTKESRDTAHTITSSSTSSSTTTRASPSPKGFPKLGGKGGSPPKLPSPTSRSIAPPSRSPGQSSTTPRAAATTPRATGAATSTPTSRPIPGLLGGARSTTGWGTAAAGPTHAPDRVGPATGWDRHAKTHSFQIILSGTPDLAPNAKSVTPNVDVYDVDLFMTDKTTITTLKRLNKTVICYFSGGTYEPGRPDSRKFATADMGVRLLEWPSEKWLKLNSTAVRRIMADRIKLASEKGCDAIDPDNIDGYQALGSGGLSLKRQDSINFVRFLSETAEKYSMATGLKNAMDMIRDIRPYVHFAVNEQCADKRECRQYTAFQKPVFHIEYPRSDREMAKGLSAATRQRYCVDTDTSINKFFHTVIKPKELNGVVQYCDGKLWKTPTKEGKGGRSRSGYFESHEPAIGETPSPKEWQHDPEMIQLQEDLAKKDGYPYGPGQGSENLVSDADLMKTYDRERKQEYSSRDEASEDDESI